MRSNRLLAVLVGTIAAAGSAGAQDVAAGAAVFKAQCSACHAVQDGKNGVGPSLFGIVGRTAGQVTGFHYSAANKAAKLTWDEATLDRYLASPKDIVPGTTMPYGGLKDAGKRTDLIAYLGTLR